MSIDVTSLYVLVAFIAAYFILRRWLFGPLGAILEARETEDRSAAKVHAESVERLAAAVARAEQQLAAARREALKEREALRAEGRTELEKRLDQAHAAATETLSAAAREISEEAGRSSAELPQRVRDLARALAAKVLGRELAA